MLASLGDQKSVIVAPLTSLNTNPTNVIGNQAVEKGSPASLRIDRLASTYRQIRLRSSISRAPRIWTFLNSLKSLSLAKEISPTAEGVNHVVNRHEARGNSKKRIRSTGSTVQRRIYLKTVSIFENGKNQLGFKSHIAM